MGWSLRADDQVPTRHAPTFAPRNSTFTAWIHLQPPGDLDDTLRLTATHASLDRTGFHLTVTAGEHVAIPVTVHADAPITEASFRLTARLENTTDARGDPVNATVEPEVVPQVRARFLTPTPWGPGHETPRYAWADPVPVRVRLENPWSDPTGPLPLVLRTGLDNELTRREIPSLGPNETRTLELGPYDRLDLQGGPDARAPDRDGSRTYTLSLVLHRDAGDPVAVHDYPFPASHLPPFTATRAQVVMLRGLHVDAQLESNLTAGEPNTLHVTARHWGGTDPITTRLRTVLQPHPVLHYGPERRLEARETLQLEPGDEDALEIPFTPHVRTTYTATMTHGDGRDARSIHHRFAWTPLVDVDIVGQHHLDIPVGEPARVHLRLRSTTVLEDARLDIAVGTRHHDPNDGPPLRSFTTGRDLLHIDLQPERLDLEPNETRHANVTLEPRGTGWLSVVPTLTADGIVHVDVPPNVRLEAYWSGLPNHELPSEARDAGALALTVHDRGHPGPITWLPLLLVAAGAITVEAHRRWRVH